MSLQFFPNPAQENLFFEYNENSEFEYLILTDINGKTVKNVSILDRNEIDISDVTPGIYFVYLIHQDNKMISKPNRIVVQ